MATSREKVLAFRAKNPEMRMSAMAAELGISRQRVEQILKSAGMPTKSSSAPFSRPEYCCWWNMLDRCLNPKSQDFDNYGARGITVCQRWRVFNNFLADMGMRPSRRHTLDRINNDGNYDPANCRWATKKQQGRNRRGLTMTPAKVAEIRRRYAGGETQVRLAKEFGTSQYNISSIVRGRTWSD